MANSFKVEVEVDIDKYLMGDPSSYDEDGIPQSFGPNSLEEIVISGVVQKLVARIVTEDTYKGIAGRIRDLRDSIIREHLEPLIVATLNKPLVKTNTWGEPVNDGSSTSLRDEIMAQATDILTKKTRDRSGYASDKTLVQKLIADEVNAVFVAELKQEIAKAKADAQKAVRTKAADVIAESIVKMAEGK